MKTKTTTTPAAALTDVPPLFGRCANTTCSQCATCLRALAWSQDKGERAYMPTLSPALATGDEHCAHYCKAEALRYARGFTRMMNQMSRQGYDRFRDWGIGHFGHTFFYEMRRGEKAISPEQQDYLLNMARKVGLTDGLEFDTYEESIAWKE